MALVVLANDSENARVPRASTPAERFRLCIALSDLYLALLRVVVLHSLFDSSDEERDAAWQGINEEHWPEAHLLQSRPGDPRFRFNDLQSKPVSWW